MNVSFQNVSVELLGKGVPCAELQEDGTLVLKCLNFTGSVVLRPHEQQKAHCNNARLDDDVDAEVLIAAAAADSATANTQEETIRDDESNVGSVGGSTGGPDDADGLFEFDGEDIESNGLLMEMSPSQLQQEEMRDYEMMLTQADELAKDDDEDVSKSTAAAFVADCSKSDKNQATTAFSSPAPADGKGKGARKLKLAKEGGATPPKKTATGSKASAKEKAAPKTTVTASPHGKTPAAERAAPKRKAKSTTVAEKGGKKRKNAAAPATPQAAATTTTTTATTTTTTASTTPTTPALTASTAVVVQTGGCPPPLGRWGHSTALIGSKKMVLYGGQVDEEEAAADAAAASVTVGDLHIFDFETNCWSKPVNSVGMERTWHTSCFFEHKDLLVVFGGERTVHGEPETLDNISVLDTSILLWYPPAIRGKTPSARSGHSAAVLGTDLVIFGGVGAGRRWPVNLTVLDTERWIWITKPTDGSPPIGRSYHSATVVNGGECMVVFGGNNDETSFNDVITLSPSTARWTWARPLIMGTPPCPRTGHVAVLLADNKTILIQGGWDPSFEDGKESKYFSDSFYLDTELWEWSAGPYMGAEASDKRVGHSAVLIDTGASKDQEKSSDAAAGGSGSEGSSNDDRASSNGSGSSGGTAAAAAGGGGGGGGGGVAGKKSLGTVAFFGGQDSSEIRRNDMRLVECLKED